MLMEFSKAYIREENNKERVSIERLEEYNKEMDTILIEYIRMKLDVNRDTQTMDLLESRLLVDGYITYTITKVKEKAKEVKEGIKGGKAQGSFEECMLNYLYPLHLCSECEKRINNRRYTKRCIFCHNIYTDLREALKEANKIDGVKGTYLLDGSMRDTKQYSEMFFTPGHIKHMATGWVVTEDTVLVILARENTYSYSELRGKRNHSKVLNNEVIAKALEGIKGIDITKEIYPYKTVAEWVKSEKVAKVKRGNYTKMTDCRLSEFEECYRRTFKGLGMLGGAGLAGRREMIYLARKYGNKGVNYGELDTGTIHAENVTELRNKLLRG